MYAKIQETAAWLKAKMPSQPQTAIILGTGLGHLAEHIEKVLCIPYSEIPNFPVSTVEGHSGQLIFGRLGGKDVMAMEGRFHYYEGYNMQQVTFPIRVMYELGIKTLFVSNAAGGTNPNFHIGDVMIITDHINFMPENPLHGPNVPTGPRFPDMSEAYSHRLVKLADEIAAEKGIKVQHGVYLATQGPTYETPSEYRMFGLWGADAVGMSTVPEVIVAHHCGIQVFGVSVITDMGVSGQIVKVTHEEVQRAANEAQPRMAAIMEEMIRRSERTNEQLLFSQMEISELGEFGLISQLTSDIKLENESSIKGVGDDCAILAPAEGMRTLVTTDLLMEGVHFDLTYVPLYCLGYKAVMVNLSDVYAMGGTPRQITVSLAISRRFRVEDIAEIYRGMRMACAKHHVDIVGGDTTSSFTGLAISITAIGEARPEEIVCRDGAQDTDLICVSGNLGAAYMGLQLLERERAVYNQQLAEAKKSGNKDEMARLQDFQPDVSGREYLLERQLKPEARADIIATLRQAGIHPTSMMDISDGLSSELMHICTQSHVGCRVYEERIPLDYQTAAMAEELNMNVSTCALNGGEDYELLFTVPLAANETVSQLEDIKVIGYITPEAQGRKLISRDGNEFELKAQGWNPLKE